MLIRRLVILFILSPFLSNFSYSQGIGMSPYSVFGVGELMDDAFGPQQMMGGAGVSFANTFYLNEINPALLSKGRVINGVKYVGFNVGGTGYFRNIEQNDKLNKDFGLNLSKLAIAFPVVPKWTFGFNFRPYSVMDYEVERTANFEGSSSIANYKYKDLGSISKVGFVNSVQPIKGLYLGIEGQYFSGNISHDTTMNFLGTQSFTQYISRQNLSGFSAKGGLAYQQKLSKNWFLNVGGTYQLASGLKGENIQVFRQYEGTEVTALTAVDTLALGNNSNKLPGQYKLGFSLEKTYNWLFAFDYGVTEWEKNNIPVGNSSLDKFRNSRELSFGLEWIPDVSSHSYFNQVFYRLGYKSVNTPYVINTTRIKDNSVSFGLSLPLGQGTNYLDLGLAVGQRGTALNNLIKENYVKFTFGFSLSRDWFHKPTIN